MRPSVWFAGFSERAGCVFATVDIALRTCEAVRRQLSSPPRVTANLERVTAEI